MLQTPHYERFSFEPVLVRNKLRNGALVKARKILGLSVKDAAEGIGISYTSYIHWENLIGYPSPENQSKVCAYFGSKGLLLEEEEVFPKELIKPSGRKNKRLKHQVELVLFSTISNKLPLVPGPESEFLMREERKSLEGLLTEVLSRLNGTEEFILRSYFLENRGVEYIKTLLSISRQRVYQRIKQIKKKIRQEHPKLEKLLYI